MKIWKLSLALFSKGLANRIFFKGPIYDQGFISDIDTGLDKNSDYCDRTQVSLFI